MSVASNTFKRTLKAVATKSGKPEEVLALKSGAKVSVNKGELLTLTTNALQENTVRDIQVALGIPGKHNNLKGMGAKNVLSFDTGAGGDDASDDDSGEADASSPGPAGTGDAPGGDETSDMGGQDDPDDPTGPGTFGGQEVGPDFGQEEDEWGVSLKQTTTKNIRSRISKAQANRQQQDEEFVNRLVGIKPAIKTKSKTKPDINIELKSDKDKEAADLKLTKQVLAFVPPSIFTPISLALTEADDILGKMSAKGRTSTSQTPGFAAAQDAAQADAAAAAAAAALGAAVGSPTSGVGSPGPGPGDDNGGGDDFKPRPALSRAASNNTTLAIAENEDFGSRKNLRRIRRQITRFA
jgi:hypothetical protein